MKTKVKVFRFQVSNFAVNATEDEQHQSHFKRAKAKIVSEEEIENTINKFLEDKNFVSLHVSNLDVKYHNNGRSNTIDLVYSIVYTD